MQLPAWFLSWTLDRWRLMFNSSKGLGSEKGPGVSRDILLGQELCWDGPSGLHLCLKVKR